MEGIIHIAGVIPRMGTTTLALQLVRFLQESGYDACYVEMSRQDYIWGAANIYKGAALDRATGRTTCLGIHMFGSERIGALREGNPLYDYVVCDFGNLADAAFNKQQFAWRGLRDPVVREQAKRDIPDGGRPCGPDVLRCADSVQFYRSL